MSISEFSIQSYEYLLSLGIPSTYNLVFLLVLLSSLLLIISIDRMFNSFSIYNEVLFLISVITTLFLFSVIINTGKSYTVRTASIPIYTLDNTSEMRGSFILGNGNINTSHGYIAFTEKDGGFIKTILPEDSIIYQGDYKPHYEYNECINKYLNEVEPCKKEKGKPLEPKIFIPKNSIIQKYNLN